LARRSTAANANAKLSMLHAVHIHTYIHIRLFPVVKRNFHNGLLYKNTIIIIPLVIRTNNNNNEYIQTKENIIIVKIIKRLKYINDNNNNFSSPMSSQ